LQSPPPRRFRFIRDCTLLVDPAQALRLRRNTHPKEDHVYWILSILVGGLGFAWVMTRRRRKVDHKIA